MVPSWRQEAPSEPETNNVSRHEDKVAATAKWFSADQCCPCLVMEDGRGRGGWGGCRGPRPDTALARGRGSLWVQISVAEIISSSIRSMAVLIIG